VAVEKPGSDRAEEDRQAVEGDADVGWSSAGSQHEIIDVPDGLTGVRALATGPAHTLALKTDGTVVTWGNNQSGRATVPGAHGPGTLSPGTRLAATISPPAPGRTF
jgi:hypothetical protein